MNAQPREGDACVTAILGMHRSGTSLVTRLLNLAGLALGDQEDMVAPAGINPRGFWENRALLDINERLLEHFGATFLTPTALPEDWVARARATPLWTDAHAAMSQFRGQKQWGWKDPRTSLTLPFWREVLTASGVTAPLRSVICVRNPLDAAASQRAACARPEVQVTMPPEISLLLWYHYTERALRHAPPEARTVVFYEDLLDDHRAALPPVLDFLGLPPLSATDQAAVDAFLERDLQHHRHTRDQVRHGADVPPCVRHLYEALREGTDAVEQVLADPTRLEDGSHLSDLFRRYGLEMEVERLTRILESPSHRLIHRLAPQVRQFRTAHRLLTGVLHWTADHAASRGKPPRRAARPSAPPETRTRNLPLAQ